MQQQMMQQYAQQLGMPQQQQLISPTRTMLLPPIQQQMQPLQQHPMMFQQPNYQPMQQQQQYQQVYQQVRPQPQQQEVPIGEFIGSFLKVNAPKLSRFLYDLYSITDDYIQNQKYQQEMIQQQQHQLIYPPQQQQQQFLHQTDVMQNYQPVGVPLQRQQAQNIQQNVATSPQHQILQNMPIGQQQQYTNQSAGNTLNGSVSNTYDAQNHDLVQNIIEQQNPHQDQKITLQKQAQNKTLTKVKTQVPLESAKNKEIAYMPNTPHYTSDNAQNQQSIKHEQLQEDQKMPAQQLMNQALKRKKPNSKDKPQHEKKPMTPYQLFQLQISNKLRKEHDDAKNNDLAKISGDLWGQLSYQEKDMWRREALKRAEACGQNLDYEYLKTVSDPSKKKKKIIVMNGGQGPTGGNHIQQENPEAQENQKIKQVQSDEENNND